jgi:hypothetical protein
MRFICRCVCDWARADCYSPEVPMAWLTTRPHLRVEGLANLNTTEGERAIVTVRVIKPGHQDARNGRIMLREPPHKIMTT